MGNDNETIAEVNTKSAVPFVRLYHRYGGSTARTCIGKKV
jgi:hypothetical protein